MDGQFVPVGGDAAYLVLVQQGCNRGLEKTRLAAFAL